MQIPTASPPVITGLPAADGRAVDVSYDYDIVILGTVEWLVVHSVTEYTALGFADKGCRVLFVEPFNSLPTLLREAALQKRRRNGGQGLRKAGERLWVYSPPPIGMPGGSRWAWPTELNGRILAGLLRPVLKELNFDRPIVYTCLYNSASALAGLPARLTVYDCGDEDAALARSPRQANLVRRHEAILCEQVDLVLAVTEELAAPRRKINPRTFEVNCAADAEFFSRAGDPATEVPADIANLPKPVLGYMGGLDPWKMDVELLKYLAASRPEWSIALVGYVWFGFDPAPLLKCSNIHVLGRKPYERFPGYLKGMDVCLMPFPLNDITRNGDALKCYEYLAAGKPVVSTPVPAAKRMSDVVRIASTPAEFLLAIEQSLAEPPGASKARMAAIVAGHTWKHRVDQKLSLISRTLNSK